MRRLPIKLGLVEYYNTEPILHGLSAAPDGTFEIERAIPADCAKLYQSGAVDLALMPVASYFEQKDSKIIGDYGICCHQAVRTVVLFANESIDQIDHIILDNHSRTSVKLLKVLMKNYFKRTVTYETADVSNVELVKGNAVLMIGDKVFFNEHRFNHCYDLGEAWFDFKKLPFVFAVWVGKSSLSEELIETLNQYIAIGLAQIPEMIDKWNQKYNLDLGSYFQENINYKINDSEKESIKVFKNEISQL